jgi:hypothetical protein
MMAQKPLDPETKEWFADSTYGLLKLGSGRGRQHENVAVGLNPSDGVEARRL